MTQLPGLSLIPQPDILPLNNYKGLSEFRSITASAFLQAHRLGFSRRLLLVAMATSLILRGFGRVFGRGLNTNFWGEPILMLVSAIATDTEG